MAPAPRARLAAALVLLALLAVPARAQVQVVFADSPDTTQWAASWGFAGGGSSLALVNTSHAPIENRRAFLGRNGARLAWTAAAGGAWELTVATNGWTAFDSAPYDTIVFAAWSAGGVSGGDLPLFFLEDANNVRTPPMPLSAFVAQVPAGAWTRVAIPLSAVRAAPGSADLSRINKVFFAQAPAMTPGVPRAMDVDEIRFVAAGLAAPALGAVEARAWELHAEVRWDPAQAPGAERVRLERADGGAWAYAGDASAADGAAEDWLGATGATAAYRAFGVGADLRASAPQASASVTTRVLSDPDWLDMTEEAAFRYFWLHGHPACGLARERYGSGDVCATGGTGMGLMAIVAAADRGWITRAAAAARVRQVAEFYDTRPRLFHGAFSHWIDGTTGLTIPFDAPDDSSGDIVETGFLVQGLLAARRYFDAATPDEEAIRALATHIWERVDWNAYRPNASSPSLYWLWSSTYGFSRSFPLAGWNEAMVVYLLAKASPTHPIPAWCWAQGWARNGAMRNGKVFYGYALWVGPDYGGGLALYQYSCLGFDPRGRKDAYSPFEWQARDAALIDRAYCAANPGGYAGYSADVWGITASDDPWGYSNRGPYAGDNGTLVPSAALGMMPFTPSPSLAALKAMYRGYGASLWGPFGFRDAFNPSQHWTAASYIAIDQGPIAVMIENARSGLLWDLFMANPEIAPACDSVGIVLDPHLPSGVGPAPGAGRLALAPPAPNPSRGLTRLDWVMAAAADVRVEILDPQGRRVATLWRGVRGPGAHTVSWDGRDDAGRPVRAGVYLARVRAGGDATAARVLRLR